MKRITVVASILLAIHVNAQTDSALTKKTDTIKVGNMLIVSNQEASLEANKNRTINHGSKSEKERSKAIKIMSGSDTLIVVNGDTVKVGRLNIINNPQGNGNKGWESLLEGDFKKTNITINRSPKKLKNISTNWWIFDLGFANYVDNTPSMYSALPYSKMGSSYVTSADLKLKNEKSSNVNIWIVQQKANLYQHYWNLKYGIGLEMYNFRFIRPISFSNTPGNYVYFDNVNFSKDKLFVEYLTVPVQLNYQSNPYNNKSFYASFGLSAGYLVQSHTKQISEERGKRKLNGNFNLNNVKMATIGELGIGSLRLYGSYSLTNLFDKNLTNFDMAPFAIGVRFSKF
jgi:hypothetical protein